MDIGRRMNVTVVDTDGLLANRLLLRSDEVAGVLGLSPATVRRMLASGALPSVVINRGSRRVSVEVLVAWVRARSDEGHGGE